MADEPKTTERGWSEKLRTQVQRGELKTVELLGGNEAAELATKAFQAGNEGKPLERGRLGFEAEAKIARHLYDEAKGVAGELKEFVQEHPGVKYGAVGGLAGAVVGYEIEKAVSGGQDVETHGGAPVTPAKPASPKISLKK